ncbi:MAG TPA: CPBP family intramembrane metalloprotease [Epulopiscium sp.]|nr:CPBP family intramembrane metalloprotease [Candidatus Epulonipiscium sp.]
MENQIMETKKVFRRIGLALFTMLVGVMLVQKILEKVLTEVWPNFMEGAWGIWILIGVPFYAVGIPIFFLMTKKISSGPKGEKKKMSFKEIVVMFIISMAAVYIFNILGNVINTIIGLIKGSPVKNPLLGLLDGANFFATLLFVGILSPIAEEIVFRGIMLDKLRIYGDKIAICFTALAFGLFHGNLSQFFYAFALGLLFGYIATKTNRIKYTVIFHMGINIIGGVMMPLVLKLLPLDKMSDPNGLDQFAPSAQETLMILGVGLSMMVMVIGIIIAGIILYLKNIKKVELEPGQIEIDPTTKKRTIYFNIGMILFYGACLVMFVLAILA